MKTPDNGSLFILHETLKLMEENFRTKSKSEKKKMRK